ncbi:diguanylate cyclase (GGDEF)-like protein [Chromohalobacter marismortui]|uniref:diguanylate cyclase n=1 Tax=Chromohalobacter marismortui TaxID=42055 RepID=A0A4V3F485_9GAMM|nr:MULTISPECIES: GGDEF domain-containing protein [Chromohalobacter]MCI0509171.1 GGDEF domain-containing protein [Chromohalobacter sp.]MCI0592047.1 GGDEF domain-containing protein [Chromohalobacter sp.]TDU23936.1 diguanylate cyclase (GGDEF)-like protein [Chromohalobacter marismortui]
MPLRTYFPWAGRGTALPPYCPLPPESRRYFDTFAQLYGMALVAYIGLMLPLFVWLGHPGPILIVLFSVLMTCGARGLHHRGHMAWGAILLWGMMLVLIVEAIRLYGTGVGFEFYVGLALLVLHTSAIPRSYKIVLSLLLLGVIGALLMHMHQGAPWVALSPAVATGLLWANLALTGGLIGSVLMGFEGVTERLERAYRREALHDMLTGALNRRAILAIAERWRCAKRPFALVLLDVDHFKRFNDLHGHATGDAALCHLVNCLRQGLRDGDVLGRYGGEEFLLLLPGTSRSDAMAVAERVALVVRDQPLMLPDKSLGMTISQGIAIHDEAATLRELLELADQRLYAAKRGGRDRVMAWEIFDTLSPVPSRYVVEGAEACPFELPRRHDDSVIKA